MRRSAMEIGIIAPTWLPVPAPAYGGTEAVIDTLARGLQSAGHDVVLVCHPDSTCPVLRASVVPAVDTVRMGRASIELEHALGAYDVLRHCDIVHDHTLAGPVIAAGRSLQRVVATNHMPFTRTMNAVFGAAAEYVGLIAISRSHAASTDLPISAVVHHGVDVLDFPIGLGDGGYAAVLSRMAPDKGVHRAIAIAKAAGVPLRIAAKMREPRECEYFARYVEPELTDEIQYVGELDHAAKRALLADAVALLNPIMWPEPFGMAMLESLACGTPVIGSPHGAAPEIVEHGVSGYLSDDDQQLVDALVGVGRLDRDACRRRAAEHFSVERMIDGHLAAYEAQLRRR